MSAVSVRKLRKTVNDYISAQMKREAERDLREAKLIAERKKSDAERKKSDAERKKSDAERDKREEEGFKRLREQLGSLGISYGEQVEAMFVNLGDKFNALGYDFPKEAKGGVKFFGEGRRILVEVDQFLENGEVVMPVEIKAKLKIDDVNDHLKRCAKIREYNSIQGDNRRVLGAIGGGVVPKNVREYATKKGLYVLVQNGDSVEVANVPMGFKPTEW